MTGIYEIWIGEDFYQGRSKKIEYRIKQHHDMLNAGSHGNVHMQRAYDKHRSFDWHVLVECDVSACESWEQSFIDANFGHIKYLNVSPSAHDGGWSHFDRTGCSLSDDHKAKISLAAKRRTGMKHSEETKRKIAESRIGRKFPRKESN